MRAGDLLSESPVRRFHYTILAASFLGWMFDAMNSGLISFVLTPLAQELSLSPPKRGFFLALGYGVFVDGFLIGMAADLLGRRTVITVALLLYSIPVGLTGLATSWQLILVLRFVAGVGTSGFMAAISTFISEYSRSAAEADSSRSWRADRSSSGSWQRISPSSTSSQPLICWPLA